MHWVPRLRRGEPEAIAWCYGKYAGGLLTLACRLAGEPSDAEDVVQDVFVSLPAALARYEERGAFAAWLRQLTVRQVLMHRRRSARRREVPHHEQSLNVVATPALDDSGALLERALLSLSEPLRQVFVLRVLEGHSHAKIADLLGITVGASEVRLSRALKSLRGLLGDQR